MLLIALLGRNLWGSHRLPKPGGSATPVDLPLLPPNPKARVMPCSTALDHALQAVSRSASWTALR
eukprot:2529944-Alexandrium_andersonii.AAC.1